MHEFYTHEKRISTVAVVVMHLHERTSIQFAEDIQHITLLLEDSIDKQDGRNSRVALLERSLGFSKAVARLYVVNGHISTAPTPKTE
jgi:hypothetical protein